MLSRIAESLFWTGRYVERADDTSRLLQAHLRLLVEGAAENEAAACRNLLALMSIEAEGEPDPRDLLRILGYDTREPTSIVSSWTAARNNARRAREVIPSTLWECINTTWQRLPSGPLSLARAHTFLEWARERGALFTGIARSIMVRDDGWQFLLLGRSLEQTDMTSRIIASAALPSGGSQWSAVLRSCGGHDAFLRTYRGFHADQEAAEFLLVDARFPRSVMHGLGAAADCLRHLAGVNPTAAQPTATALRSLGQLRSRLEYTPMDELLVDLHREMTGVQDVCAQVTATVSSTFFAADEPQPWITEGTR